MFGLNLISEVKEKIMMHLIEHDFLNEERYANSFVRGKFKHKKWGKIKIINELNFKGVSSYNINKAMLQIEVDQYQKTIASLAQKKVASLKGIEKNIRFKKTVRYLQQKGFELDLSIKTTNKVNNF